MAMEGAESGLLRTTSSLVRLSDHAQVGVALTLGRSAGREIPKRGRAAHGPARYRRSTR